MANRKNKNLAGILALIFGTLGIHKFYLNKVGIGIFYIFLNIFFSLTIKLPLTFLLGIKDAVTLFNMTDQEFNSTYNNGSLEKTTDRIKGENSKSLREIERMEAARKKYNYKKNLSSNPFIKSGEKKQKEFDLEGAEEDFIKAMELTPENFNLYFSMAQVQSLLENKEKAFYYLEEGIRLGFKDTEKINTIDELAYLRIQKEFIPFVENGYKTTKVKEKRSRPIEGDVLLSQLNKLKDLRKRGLLSDKEYIYEKEKLRN